MKILVLGATGGSGRAITEELLQRGHAVTAFSRHASGLPDLPGDLTRVDGDATRPRDVLAVVPGHDAVVVALGISESAVRVRLRGAAHTSGDVRSRGTAAALEAMRESGVERIVVQSSFGVGETRDLLPWAFRMFFALVLRPQIADTERQEEIVRAGRAAWTFVQPVNLTDGPAADPLVTTDGRYRSSTVSRRSVARVVADALDDPAHVGRTLTVSG